MNKLLVQANISRREGLSWDETWKSYDHGLIACWERGRSKGMEEAELAERAKRGELVLLAWKGGTENVGEPTDGSMKTKSTVRYGTLEYLATWQGIRGEDLDIDFESERTIICSRTKLAVIFRRFEV